MRAKSAHNPHTRQSTKERILEAAQRLFAEKGLDATSMRHITEAARANLASINYHFGSKDALIAAIFARHLGPLNAARLGLLDTVEQKADPDPPCIEEVLEAFIRPVVFYHLTSSQDAEAFVRLLGRCLNEPPSHIRHIRPHFDALMERFREAVARALPGLSQDEVFWALHFTLGAVHHTLHMWSHLEQIPRHPTQPLDAEGLARRLVDFTAAGVKSMLGGQPAPAPAQAAR